MTDSAAPSGADGDRRRASRGTLAALGAIPVGLLLSGALVWQSSYAAFTAVADNGANAWTAGTVTLTGDDGSSSASGATGTALFDANGLKPGDTGVNCLTVTYGGSLDAKVKVYISSHDSSPLAAQIDLDIDEGTGGGYGDCTGFTSTSSEYSGTLAGLAATHSAFGSGVGTWAPTGGGQTRTYRVRYTLKSTAPNSVQGETATATMTWEANNT